MIVTHNLSAINANRQLGVVDRKSKKSMEKLSSGYKINRAGDDAAGLAISEKMRGQIRGLNRASRNMEDGISLVQTADGAMQEVSNILQRQRELCVQAANDTNTADDRQHIQKEINALSQEITRISDQTEFNTRKILKGSKESFQVVKKVTYEELVTEYKPITKIIETQATVSSLTGSYETASMPDWVLGTNSNYPPTKTTNTGYLTENVETSMVSYTRTLSTYDAVNNSWKDLNTKSCSLSNYEYGIQSYTRIQDGTEDPQGILVTYQNGKTSNTTLNSLPYSIREHLSKNKNNKVVYQYNEEDAYRSGAYVDFSNLNQYNIFDLINEDIPQSFNSTCCTCSNRYSVQFVNTGTSSYERSGQHYIYYVDISDLLDRASSGEDVTGEDVVNQILTALGDMSGSTDESGGISLQNHFSIYAKDENNENCLIIYDERSGYKGGGDRGKFEWGTYREEGYSSQVVVSSTLGK